MPQMPPMYVSLLSIVFWATAGTYLVYRIRASGLDVYKLLYPISAYLYGVATMQLFLLGITLFGVPQLLVGASVALVLGAAMMPRYVLNVTYPRYRDAVYALAAAGVAGVLYVFSAEGGVAMFRFAHLFAFVSAGLITVGYLLYKSLSLHLDRGKKAGTGLSLSLGLCCVVSHAVIAFPIISALYLPFIDASVPAPWVLSVLAPFSVIAVLVLVHYLPVPGKQH